MITIRNNREKGTWKSWFGLWIYEGMSAFCKRAGYIIILLSDQILFLYAATAVFEPYIFTESDIIQEVIQ